MYVQVSIAQSANAVTGDETWVQFYESQGKVRNKIWAMKSTQRPCIARTLGVQMEMYAIFFSTQGLAIQIAAPYGRGVTGKFNCDKVRKNLNSTTVKATQRVELRTLEFSTTTLLHTKQVLGRNFCSRKMLQFCPIPPLHLI